VKNDELFSTDEYVFFVEFKCKKYFILAKTSKNQKGFPQGTTFFSGERSNRRSVEYDNYIIF